jgi:hypothetical protein
MLAGGLLLRSSIASTPSTRFFLKNRRNPREKPKAVNTVNTFTIQTINRRLGFGKVIKAIQPDLARKARKNPCICQDEQGDPVFAFS